MQNTLPLLGHRLSSWVWAVDYSPTNINESIDKSTAQFLKWLKILPWYVFFIEQLDNKYLEVNKLQKQMILFQKSRKKFTYCLSSFKQWCQVIIIIYCCIWHASLQENLTHSTEENHIIKASLPPLVIKCNEIITEDVPILSHECWGNFFGFYKLLSCSNIWCHYYTNSSVNNKQLRQDFQDQTQQRCSIQLQFARKKN